MRSGGMRLSSALHVPHGIDVGTGEDGFSGGATSFAPPASNLGKYGRSAQGAGICR
jgi:hypothetical protein